MSKKVLIIDDDLPILEVMKIILEEKGYEIEVISNPKNIEKKIEQSQPALILLDIWVAGMHGADIVKLIHNNNAISKIPVVLISANNEVEKIAKECGATSFLSKPFDIDDLAALVQKNILN